MSPPAVRLDAATRDFGLVRALAPLDLTVAAGSCIGIIGHNGSGKSTLLQLIAGRLRPTAGTVEVEGHDLATAAGRQHARWQVAVGGATAAFYPDLTVADHVAMVGAAFGLDDVEARVDLLLGHLGLADRREALPAQLSTGMRQKLDLALAFVRPATILLLDEPDRGLDPGARTRLAEDVARVRGEGRTILLATHHPDGWEELLDEVLLLEAGDLLVRGSLDEVRRSDAATRLGLS